MKNRPVTRGANIPNQSMTLNPTRADDRPMTRGGLGGFQANTGGFNRQIQDKSYFLGILRYILDLFEIISSNIIFYMIFIILFSLNFIKFL